MPAESPSSALGPAGGAPLDTPSAVAPACTNCRSGPVGRFCAACGQRQVAAGDFTARAFVRDVLGEMVSFDGRLWLTLFTLVRHPGKLAREFFDGRGSRYMRPLNLFLLLNLVFFLIQPHTGMLQWHLKGYLGYRNAPGLVDRARMARGQEVEHARELSGAPPRPVVPESMDIFESRFEATLQGLKKSMLLIAIPMFALGLALIYARTGHRLAEHLIFSTHFYAFAVFALTAIVPLAFSATFGWLLLLRVPQSRVFSLLGGETPLAIALLLLLGGYLYVALRHTYGDSRRAALARAVAMFGVYQGLVFAFAFSAFRITLWAM